MPGALGLVVRYSVESHLSAEQQIARLAIILAALSANILGDSVRDFLDPQLRKL